MMPRVHSRRVSREPVVEGWTAGGARGACRVPAGAVAGTSTSSRLGGVPLPGSEGGAPFDWVNWWDLSKVDTGRAGDARRIDEPCCYLDRILGWQHITAIWRRNQP
jgi:hypothetical protein